MKPRLKLTLQIAVEGAGLPTRKQFQRWAEAAVRVRNRPVEVSVRLVDALEGRELNRTYRGKDYATNVLTFTYDELPDVPGLPLMGDLALCHDVVVAEAQAQGKPLEAHYAHLTVHGLLHLQGFDHEDDAEAEAMEALETEILAGLGYADPYAAEKTETLDR